MVSVEAQALRSSISSKYARITLLGLALTVVLLVDPVDTLSEQYLTVHMFQHIGLFLFSALVGYGIDRLLVTRLAYLKKRAYHGWKAFVSLMKFNSRTRGIIFAGIIPGVVFYFWGLPSNFDLAITNSSIHILEHFCVIISGGLAGASFNAISKRFRALLLMLGFMMAGMMGSMMLVYPPGFYSLFSPEQNLEMNTAMMLFGGLGMIAIGTWFLKVLDIV